MKGIRFYMDANGGRAKSRTSDFDKKDMPDGHNGIAILYGNGSHGTAGRFVDGIAAVLEGPGDGPYAGTSVALNYITTDCRRISEGQARQLFPNLFKRLDD